MASSTSSANRTYRIYNATREVDLSTHALLAGDSKSRREGLLKRSGLAEGEGLLISPCEAIHTFGMQFTIDVVFIDRKRRVRKVLHAMPRNRIGFCFSAEYALELAAGTAKATGTEPGDILEMHRLP
ncbi:MAG: DUF192 domain-containing protein [Bryobacterales bacterium]|jgi:hypothetical protein|nr:DUF192 domain-containing protein [Bryobacterales bacterium]